MKRSDIQVLRAVAVLSVVFYHAAPEKFGHGYLGVDIFFVISGFLVAPKAISAINSDIARQPSSHESLMKFYKRRYYRLAPSVFSVLAFTLVTTLIFIPPADFHKIFFQATFSLLGIGNIGAYLFAGDYFSPHPNSLLHMWSLAVEEQIYLLFPIILLLMSKLKRISSYLDAKRILICLTLVSLFLHLLLQSQSHLNENYQLFDFYNPLSRFFEFGVGALIASYGIKLKIKNLVAYISYVAILFCLFIPYSITPILTPSVIVLTIVILSNSGDYASTKIFRPLVLIGNESYSIYLFHLPLLYIAFYTPLWKDNQNREFLKLLACVVTFAVAHFNFRYIEYRNIKQGKINLPKSRHLTNSIKWSVLPLLIFTLLSIASTHKFFGLDPNAKPLPDPALSLGKCYSITGEKPCELGATYSKKKALLIGDSHARHLGKTFFIEASRMHYQPVIWTQSGCQFVLPSSISSDEFRNLEEKYGVRHKGETQSCFQHNLQIVTWLQRNPNTVVVTTFRSTSMVAIDLGIEPTLYRGLLAKNLKGLEKLSKNLIVIGPNPEYLDSAKFFGGGTLIWQSPYERIAKARVLRMNMSPYAFQDDNYYEVDLGNRSGITYISAVRIFCNPENCIRKRAGKWLYTDVDHLSIFGTKMIAPFLQSALRTAT